MSKLASFFRKNVFDLKISSLFLLGLFLILCLPNVHFRLDRYYFDLETYLNSCENDEYSLSHAGKIQNIFYDESSNSLYYSKIGDGVYNQEEFYKFLFSEYVRVPIRKEEVEKDILGKMLPAEKFFENSLRTSLIKSSSLVFCYTGIFWGVVFLLTKIKRRGALHRISTESSNNEFPEYPPPSVKNHLQNLGDSDQKLLTNISEAAYLLSFSILSVGALIILFSFREYSFHFFLILGLSLVAGVCFIYYFFNLFKK
ncbi:hypothetical protein [Candidatus Spyradosoma sp. SGI.093]|uniref:hypothetical protein n=1 Tax=Candidatus Spyradosoma sp. SGI.093 TaxID=3420583 RepID=UPI003D0299F5